MADRGTGHRRSLAGLRARDLRVHAEIVQRPGEDRDHDRASLCAGHRRTVVVVALGARDGADDQPDGKDYGCDAHLLPPKGLLTGWDCSVHRIALLWPGIDVPRV